MSIGCGDDDDDDSVDAAADAASDTSTDRTVGDTGGGDASPGDAASDAGAEARFRAMCQTRVDLCEESNENCAGYAPCFALVYSPAAQDAYLACRTDDACSSDDECTVMATATGGAAAAAFESACNDRYEACEADGGEDAFDQETCGQAGVATSSLLEAFDACLDRPCDEIEDCIADTQPDVCDDV